MIHEKRQRHESVEPLHQRKRRAQAIDRHRSSSLPVPVRHTHTVVDLSEEGSDLDSLVEIDVVDDDDDSEIPYTHSRSASPEALLAHEHRWTENQLLRDSSSAAPAHSGSEVVSLDDDVDREYYVITDEEDDDEEDEEAVIEQGSQRPVSDQLMDNVKAQTSNLNNARCAVCFDSPEQTLILPCGHMYCRDCVFKALSSMKSSSKTGGPCALCRAGTSYKRVMVGIFKRKKKALEGC